MVADMSMKTRRFTGSVFSMDLLPAELSRKETGYDLLTRLRNVDDPKPNEFVDDFYIEQGVEPVDF